MMVYKKIEEFSSSRPVVLSVGNFDGLHRGHRHLLAENRQWAQKYGGESVVLSFHPHPLVFLKKEGFLPLADEENQKKGLAELSIDHWIQEAFDANFMEQSAEQFIQRLCRAMSIKAIVVGGDFCFGRGRQGNVELLKQEGLKRNFEVHVPESYLQGGVRVSSSLIRQFLREGNLTQATAFLGRPYEISGVVQSGDQRGRTLGFPTANIQSPLAGNLKLGVYKTQVAVRGQSYQGVTNVGVNPTFGAQLAARLETHVLDFNETIYGEVMAVQFLEFIRPEMKFSSPLQLIEQIERDLAYVRQS